MNEKQVLLVTAEMGYGHLRALYPFWDKPEYKFVILGQTDGSKPFEKVLWRVILKTYETISRFKDFPVLGWLLFGMLNKLLSIPPQNKKLKNYNNSFPLWLLERFIGLGLCKGIQKELFASQNLILTSFYAPVIALSKRDDVKVYCQICDADLSRAWVVRNSNYNNTHYFAPCQRAADRLNLYGINSGMIHFTGFPFSHSLVGGIQEGFAKRNYMKRMMLLDNPSRFSSDLPLEIAYVVGGAGAYSDTGMKIAIRLKDEIINGMVILYLVAGVKKNVVAEYQKFKDESFHGCINLRVVEALHLADYFQQFTEMASHIHLLWTKPSELVFYSALGIPIIMTDPLGPQEEANREWVIETGIGIDQNISKYANLWVMNKLNKGVFAKMARSGWDNGIRTALYLIPEIIDKTSS